MSLLLRIWTVTSFLRKTTVSDTSPLTHATRCDPCNGRCGHDTDRNETCICVFSLYFSTGSDVNWKARTSENKKFGFSKEFLEKFA